MSRAAGADRREPNNTNAAQHHSEHLAWHVEPIEKVIRLLAPDGKPESIAAIFDHRASVHSIRNWRRQHRYVPAWAIELLQQKLTSALDATKQIARGPGQLSGLRNMPHEIRQR